MCVSGSHADIAFLSCRTTNPRRKHQSGFASKILQKNICFFSSNSLFEKFLMSIGSKTRYLNRCYAALRIFSLKDSFKPNYEEEFSMRGLVGEDINLKK